MTASRIHHGDTIGIIAPCYIAMQDKYVNFIAGLKSIGFRIKEGKNLYKDTYGFCATEQERANDFHDMVLDDEVKMILFGGGCVGNEVLPYLNFGSIEKHPKIICSYSDGTTLLNAIYAKTGLTVYYGQSPGVFGDLRQYDYMQFKSHFVDGSVDSFVSNSTWETLCNGSCEGILVGGYTLNFAMLLGGSYFPYDSTKKYILFQENHEKFCPPAEISSHLSHIEQSGFMKNISGLLFGHYSENVYPELTQMLTRFGKRNNIPVVTCDDFGHGINHAILPIGSYARLDADKKSLGFISLAE